MLFAAGNGRAAEGLARSAFPLPRARPPPGLVQCRLDYVGLVFSGAGAGAAGEESWCLGVASAALLPGPRCFPFGGTAGRSAASLGPQQGSSEVLSLCPSDTEFREGSSLQAGPVVWPTRVRPTGPRGAAGAPTAGRSVPVDAVLPAPGLASRPCSLRQRLAGGSLEQPGVSGSLLGGDCGSEVRRQGVRGAWGPLSWNSHGWSRSGQCAPSRNPPPRGAAVLPQGRPDWQRLRGSPVPVSLVCSVFVGSVVISCFQTVG